MKIFRLMVVCCVFFLGGCAAVPELPQIEPGSIKRVGYYVDYIGHPKHTHVGTTIFNNYHREYEKNWDMRQEVTDLIVQELNKQGLEPVDLESLGFSPEDMSVVRLDDSRTGFTIASEERLARMKGNNIDAFISVSENDHVLISRSCSQYGCVEQLADGYGLFTRSFFGITRASAAFAFRVRSEILDPPALVSYSEQMEEFSKWESSSTPVSPAPKNFKEIDEESWNRIKLLLLDMMQARIERIGQTLNGGR